MASADSLVIIEAEVAANRAVFDQEGELSAARDNE
jgi:hypothetical protein